MPLSAVKDDLFSKGAMGLGYAVEPTDGDVYAPFDGTVKQLYPTRHAIGIESTNGIKMLIHIGLGTVEMQGTGFISYVDQGQKIKKGDKLLEFWDPAIKKAGLDDTVIVTVTNSNDFDRVDVVPADGTEVKPNEVALTITKD